jgi:hypothetical protein
VPEALAERSAKGGVEAEVWQRHLNDIEVAHIRAGASRLTAHTTDPADGSCTA